VKFNIGEHITDFHDQYTHGCITGLETRKNIQYYIIKWGDNGMTTGQSVSYIDGNYTHDKVKMRNETMKNVLNDKV